MSTNLEPRDQTSVQSQAEEFQSVSDAHIPEETGDHSSTAAEDHLSSTSSINEVKEFQPQNDDQNNGELQRSPSVLQKILSRLSFFNPTLKSKRLGLIRQFVTIYALMITCILAIFSIYWGASYQRNSRLHNLKMLVVIEDDVTVNGVEPVIGNTLKLVLQQDDVKAVGNWEVQNITEFNEIAKAHNNTIKEEVTRQIHHQLYWDSIYVSKNASANFKDYIENPNSQVNASELIYTIYETGRDFLNMRSYVIPGVDKVEAVWRSSQSNLLSLFNESANFNYDQLEKLLAPITFTTEDKRPFTDSVLVAPSQVGLIYIIILTFFQVNMFGEVHQEVSKFNLKHKHYVAYRLLT